MIAGGTDLFCRERRFGTSPAAAGTMPAGPAALAATAWKIDRPAALSVVPLAAWLGFATVLAGEVWRRNPQT